MNQEKLDKNYDHLFFSSPTRQIESSKNTKENIKTSTPIDTILDDSNSSGQVIITNFNYLVNFYLFPCFRQSTRVS